MGLLADGIQKKGRKSVVKKVITNSGAKCPITAAMIAKKAYELYEKRGCQPGGDVQDWNEAKRMLEAEHEEKDTAGR